MHRLPSARHTEGESARGDQNEAANHSRYERLTGPNPGNAEAVVAGEAADFVQGDVEGAAGLLRIDGGLDAGDTLLEGIEIEFH
jgi:hypothetical protein